MCKKLTQEVFTYRPVWANWAAVDCNGSAFWYSHKPKRRKIDWICYNPLGGTIRICGIFDATDWKNSLIKRQKENQMRKKLTKEVFTRPECPKWAKWAAVDADGTAYWYEEKPTQGSWGVFWTQSDHATKVVRIDEKFSLDVTLIARK